MLSQFTFENYKSYKNEVTLDFTPDSIGEHKETLIVDNKDNEEFLPVIALYGPNGGGKSTVIEAFNSMAMLILGKIYVLKMFKNNDKIESIKYDKDYLEMIMKENLYEKYHKFDEICKTKPIKYDVLFRFGQNEYRYQIYILDNLNFAH